MTWGACAAIAVVLLVLTGCNRDDAVAPAPAAGSNGDAAARQVVVYTSVDQPTAKPILDAFAKETGIEVILQTDTEASKTAGLAERLRAEKANPQADVYWGNEVFYTINLAEEQVLAPYETEAAADIPTLFKDADHRWYGTGLRARVLVTAEGVTLDELQDLTDPQFRGQIGIARPTAGTTGGHVAALYTLWGEEKADRFFNDLRANEVKVLGGNGPVAEQTAQGTLIAGVTDNDDVHNARENISPVDLVLPDQESFGTLMMPTTVGLVAGAPHPEAAKELIDWLISAETEQKLKDAHFTIASVREAREGGPVKAMQVDYRQVAAAMPAAIRRATSILEGRE